MQDAVRGPALAHDGRRRPAPARRRPLGDRHAALRRSGPPAARGPRAKRWVGFLRVYRTGKAKPRRLELNQPHRGAKGVLLRGRGKPTVRRVRGGLAISRLPRRTQVAELTIYRVTTVDGRTAEKRVPLRVRVKEAAATLRLRSTPAVSR